MTPRVTLLLGDRNGIGPELIARLLAEESTYEGATIEVFGDPAVLEQGIEVAGLAADRGRFETVAFKPVSDIETTPGRATKAAGEEAVRKAFPGAAVVRPSIVFGPEDGFFNLFARLARVSPVLPLIGGGKTRFQPVYVGDVADAVVKCLTDPDCAGKTYELGGPKVYSFKQLLELLLHEIGRRRLLAPLPFWVATLEATFLELAPVPLLTRDQVRERFAAYIDRFGL